jgi:hypothetical protein
MVILQNKTKHGCDGLYPPPHFKIVTSRTTLHPEWVMLLKNRNILNCPEIGRKLCSAVNFIAVKNEYKLLKV